MHQGAKGNDETRNQAGTPRRVFSTLHAEYKFTVDVCASAWNHKLDSYLTKEDNALDADWKGERAWCNPPYADIEPWLRKAFRPDALVGVDVWYEVEEALAVDFAAYLLPTRCFNSWWRRFKPLAECHYFEGRMQFEAPSGVKYSSNPFPVCLFLFGKGAVPGQECYRDAKTGERIDGRKRILDDNASGEDAGEEADRIVVAGGTAQAPGLVDVRRPRAQKDLPRPKREDERLLARVNAEGYIGGSWH